jgi:diketogulonate reductase-like aldo/keto reductase
MRSVPLPDGTEVPALGQGTWHMGESPRAAKQEAEALAGEARAVNAPFVDRLAALTVPVAPS